MQKLQAFLRLLCVWALLLTTQLASANAPVHPETRVGAFEVAAEACVRLSVLATSSGHQEKLDASTAEAVGYPHATRGGDDLVDAFRAVGPDELADIRATGQFRPSPYGSEGKYFTPSGQEASAYAREAVQAFGDQPYTTVRTQVPRSLLEAPGGAATVEKGIRARVIPNEALPQLRPEVLNYSPVP